MITFGIQEILVFKRSTILSECLTNFQLNLRQNSRSTNPLYLWKYTSLSSPYIGEVEDTLEIGFVRRFCSPRSLFHFLDWLRAPVRNTLMAFDFNTSIGTVHYHGGEIVIHNHQYRSWKQFLLPSTLSSPSTHLSQLVFLLSPNNNNNNTMFLRKND